MIPFVIDLMNSVNKFTNEFTDGINSVGNSVGKNDTSSFFFLCFNFFSHGNSLGIYRGNISIGKIPRKFTDGNIPSVFPFVFINFLVVNYVLPFLTISHFMSLFLGPLHLILFYRFSGVQKGGGM